MRNILSYQFGTAFTGKEILDWANHQVENQTSHLKVGKTILRKFGNIHADRMYAIFLYHPGTGCGEIKKELTIIKAEKAPTIRFFNKFSRKGYDHENAY